MAFASAKENVLRLSGFDAVLFDLDHTLFDHHYAADAAAVEWARSLPEWTGSDAEAVAQGLWRVVFG